jgi:hypothetical protein
MALSKITNSGVASSGLPTGTILQVKQTLFKGQFASSVTTNGHEEVVTGLNCAITPSSASNKILVQYTVHVGAQSFYAVGLKLYRDVTANTGAGPLGTELVDASGNDIQGDGAAGRPATTGMLSLLNAGDVNVNAPASGTLLDHPNSTSALTYSFAFRYYNFSGTAIYVNRTHNFQDDDDAAGGYDPTPVSAITLMEVS